MTPRRKAVGRFVLVLVSIVFLVLTTRAVIAYRAWTMAVTWAHLTTLPSPSGITFFSPSLYVYTYSGVFNDVTFVRVPYPKQEEADIRSALLASPGRPTAPSRTLPVPLPPEDATGCGRDKTRYRNQLYVASRRTGRDAMTSKKGSMQPLCRMGKPGISVTIPAPVALWYWIPIALSLYCCLRR